MPEKKNIKDKKQQKKESNNRIEHNILAWTEKILKKFFCLFGIFLFSQILFYTHKDLWQNNSPIVRNCPTVTSAGSHHA